MKDDRMTAIGGANAGGRDFMKPGRSMAHGLNVMAATSHPLATCTALDILRQGGNAVDAAIAAAAVLSLAEPHQSGLGGDCFALIAPKGTDQVIGYNGSGRAPFGTDPEALAGGIDGFSPAAVTIPGAVEAWLRLSADHGRLPLAQVLEPAIAFAETGVVVHERVAFDWQVSVDRITRSPFLKDRFSPGGVPLPAGSVLRFPELAVTLRAIAEHGRAGFYEGAPAREMAAVLKALGGAHSESDFAAHRGEYVTPITADYRGQRVHQCPPNGQGVIALLILGMIERLATDPDGPGGPWRMHALTEAARIAFALRSRHLGDPATSSTDWSLYLNAAFLDRTAALIRPDRRLTDDGMPDLPEHRDTVYLTVVDSERTAVSMICSVFESFGSTIVAPDSGVVLNNRGRGFAANPAHPNGIGPGRRPMHTIIPGMVTRDGRAVMSFGVMGGDYQPVGHAQLLSGMLDYGLDLQAAVDAPRLFPARDKLWVERGIDTSLRAHLTGLGHALADRVEPVGGAQAILIDPCSGVLTGASDPRKDGCALGY
jgi:gamma-glutamyltranspeptidase/glutathione hydrolase